MTQDSGGTSNITLPGSYCQYLSNSCELLYRLFRSCPVSRLRSVFVNCLSITGTIVTNTVMTLLNRFSAKLLYTLLPACAACQASQFTLNSISKLFRMQMMTKLCQSQFQIRSQCFEQFSDVSCILNAPSHTNRFRITCNYVINTRDLDLCGIKKRARSHNYRRLSDCVSLL